MSLRAGVGRLRAHPWAAAFAVALLALAALHLLACCPRMPTDVLAVLLRIQHTRSAA